MGAGDSGIWLRKINAELARRRQQDVAREGRDIVTPDFIIPMRSTGPTTAGIRTGRGSQDKSHG